VPVRWCWLRSAVPRHRDIITTLLRRRTACQRRALSPHRLVAGIFAVQQIGLQLMIIVGQRSVIQTRLTKPQTVDHLPPFEFDYDRDFNHEGTWILETQVLCKYTVESGMKRNARASPDAWKASLHMHSAKPCRTLWLIRPCPTSVDTTQRHVTRKVVRKVSQLWTTSNIS
jgi:hypothetical protein